MKFLLDNPIVFLAIVAVVARLIARVKAAAAKAESPPPGPAAPAGGQVDRTDEVRDAVRRKIAERRLAAAPPPLEPEPPPDIGSEEIEAVLARQKRLVDQMRALEEAKSRAPRPPAPGPMPAAAAPAFLPAHTASPHAFLVELRDVGNARRAIVLREILGAPVALR